MGYAVYFVLTLKWGFWRRSKISTVQMIYYYGAVTCFIYIYIYILSSVTQVWRGGGEETGVARCTTNEWRVRCWGQKNAHKNKWKSLKQLVYLQIKCSMDKRSGFRMCTRLQREMKPWAKCEKAQNRKSNYLQTRGCLSRTTVANSAILSSCVFNVV